jgi:hypothetical protein
VLVWTLALTLVVLNEEGYASTASVWVMCDMLRRGEIPTESKGCKSKRFFCNLKLYAVEIRGFEFERGF